MAEFTPQDLAAIAPYLKDRQWRINNLYYIKDPDANVVLFQQNNIQELMYGKQWYWTLVVKSRQVGSTTEFVVEAADDLFWTPHISIGFIADKRENAAKVVERIKFMHERLPAEIRNQIKITKDNASELSFSNGATIYSTNSTMSTAVQKLIVTEFGPLCERHPETAGEVVQGSFSTVNIGNRLIVESTVRKNYGYFADFINQCLERKKKGIKPTKQQFALMFFGWFLDRKCNLNPEGVPIYPRHEEYFKDIEAKCGITLAPSQKAFYVSKESILGHKMKQEFPSTVEESLEKIVEGAYYAGAFSDLRAQGRITKVPFEPGVPVCVGFDLAWHHTVLWFYQVCGREVHVIDYYAARQEKLIPHFTDIIEEKERKLGYRYGLFVFPHDAKKHEDVAVDETRLAAMRRVLGENKCVVCPRMSVAEGINITRQFLAKCWFDEERTKVGVDAMENYTMTYNNKLGQYFDVPQKDGVNDDPADAFRMLSVWETIMQKRGTRYVVNNQPGGGSIQVVQSIPTDVKAIWDAYT